MRWPRKRERRAEKDPAVTAVPREIEGLVQAMSVIMGDATEPLVQAMRLVSQGQSLFAAERYAEGLDPLEKALGLLRGTVHTAARSTEATALTEIGRVHRKLGHFQDALSHYREALALYRELGDRRGEGIVLTNAGVVHDEIEELQDAKAMFEQAIACFDAIGDEGLRDVARTNLTRLKEEEKDPLRPWRIVEWSVRLFERGAWVEAIAACEQARSLFHDEHDRTGEAGALGNLGVFYQSTGRYREALESYAAALSGYRDLKDRMGEARMLTSLGALYMDLGRTEEAAESLEAALRIPRARFDPGDALIEVGALSNLGTIYMNESRFQEALPLYGKALGIARELDDEAVPYAPTVRKTMRLRQNVASLLGNLGSAHHALGHLDQALDHLEKSLEISREVGERAGEAQAESQLGAFHQSQRHPEEASEHYGKARLLFRQVGDRHGELVALNNLAVLHLGEGRTDEADRHFAEAVRVAESLRGELPGGQLREGYLATLGSLFPTYAALLVYKGEPERALEVAEQGRARAFLDLLAENRTEIQEGVDPRLREAEQNLQSRLSALHKRLIETRSEGRDGTELEEEIRALELRLYTVEAQIRRDNPHYAALVLPTVWTLTRNPGRTPRRGHSSARLPPRRLRQLPVLRVAGRLQGLRAATPFGDRDLGPGAAGGRPRQTAALPARARALSAPDCTSGRADPRQGPAHLPRRPAPRPALLPAADRAPGRGRKARTAGRGGTARIRLPSPPLPHPPARDRLRPVGHRGGHGAHRDGENALRRRARRVRRAPEPGRTRAAPHPDRASHDQAGLRRGLDARLPVLTERGRTSPGSPGEAAAELR